MNSNWESIKLKEICEYKTGKLNSNAAEENGEFLFFTCSPETFKINSFAFDQDAVILAGNNANGEFPLKRYKGKFNAYQRTYVMKSLNEKVINNDYLYYYLTYKLNYLKNLSIGSATKFLTKTILDDIVINYPSSFSSMMNIAKTLKLIDEKINNNVSIIKNLEQLSQTLFKNWFIDFEFPNEEGKPYKSSGGEMVESELGEIPKGWKVFPLYDLAEYINGTSFKKHELQNEKNDLPIIKIAELKSGFSGNTKYFIGEKDKKYYLKNGDILFSWSGNPETSIDTFFWTRGKGILNQHIFKVVSTKYPQQLIYILLKYFKPTFSRIASNKQTTGLGHVTVKDLKRLKVVLPLDSSPYVQLNHLGDLILNLNLENIKLQELRDTLLPKLLSGEIEIPDELEV